MMTNVEMMRRKGEEDQSQKRVSRFHQRMWRMSRQPLSDKNRSTLGPDDLTWSLSKVSRKSVSSIFSSARSHKVAILASGTPASPDPKPEILFVRT
jgi:hypothetical protein